MDALERAKDTDRKLVYRGKGDVTGDVMRIINMVV